MKLTHDFDHMPGALYSKDLEGHYIWANQGFLDLLKFEMTDVIGKDDWELIKEPDDVEHIKAMDKEVIDRQEMLTCIETVRQDGTEKQFLTYKAPLRDEHGEVIGIQGCTLPLEPEHLSDLRNSL